MHLALSGPLAAYVKYELCSFQSLLFSLVSSPHFHFAFYGDYVLHFVEITDNLLKHATWNGLISHFTGLRTKKLRLCFLKVLHIHPNTSRHILNHSKLKQFVSQHFRWQTELICLPALDHSILRHTSSVLTSVKTQTKPQPPNHAIFSLLFSFHRSRIPVIHCTLPKTDSYVYSYEAQCLLPKVTRMYQLTGKSLSPQSSKRQ